ncbi:phenol hydroxylase subunit P4 [Streptomyces sp. BK022]|uniref:phenol hydroxylase subunit P4 n=1 Tax=Streptomyces sp. BK022 TaxID=2512123 RepID=UPI001A925E93|nr:phenol hydroxylase subunit P4 [Streptomyces sp. BK022]
MAHERTGEELTAMPVIALKPGYDFPSRSRQELYGTDQLVHVMWKGNAFFAAPATFRAAQDANWGEFVRDVITPWAAGDPDFDPSTLHGWNVDGVAVTPTDQDSFQSLGIGHKSLVSFET